MENTQQSSPTKLDIILFEIQNLEAEIKEVKDKMRELENEEKQENYQKNFLEVQKDKLRRSIELYQNETKAADKQLEEKLAAFSKLCLMDECYDKLLDVYTDKYLAQENPNPCQESTVLEESIFFQNQADTSEKQLKKLTSIIHNNSNTIKNYLENMHYVIQ